MPILVQRPELANILFQKHPFVDLKNQEGVKVRVGSIPLSLLNPAAKHSEIQEYKSIEVTESKQVPTQGPLPKQSHTQVINQKTVLPTKSLTQQGIAEIKSEGLVPSRTRQGVMKVNQNVDLKALFSD